MNNGHPRAPLDHEDRWQLVIYAATPVWAILFILYTPTTLVDALPRLQLLLVGVLPLIGSAVAAVGVLSRLNLYVELPGAVLRFAGPLGYLGIQVGLSIGNDDRVALVGLVFLLCVQMLPRLHKLIRLFIGRVIRRRLADYRPDDTDVQES